ncbi:MAG: PKD domain-containing protein [Candidatus Zixiibacteriota bacterium]
MTRTRKISSILLAMLGLLTIWPLAEPGAEIGQVPPQFQHHSAADQIDFEGNNWCGYKPPEVFLQEFRDAIDRGEISDPALRSIPAVAPRIEVGAVTPGPLGPGDLFLYEDTNEILRTNFSGGQLNALMVSAANALMAEHGDQWDFIAFWMNFAPATQLGAAAFYQGLENYVSGIGSGIYNARASFGVSGNNVEGFVQMFNVNDWVPGTGVSAASTRLVLGQEFEHRWACFINSEPGVPFQGDDGNCGRSAHWNFKVDGGGSGMEIAEWIGENPATKLPGSLHFSSDIPDGVFSYPDLYLMGYVSPAEMDAGMAEFRHMIGSGCGQQYTGQINPLTSEDITSWNGPRVPSSATAQKHFKTAWIMFYEPDTPPTQAHIDRALDIMEQHQTDWNVGTLGLGTMDNSITFGNFLTDDQFGPAPHTVNFTYSSDFPTSSWSWHFGDGDSSNVENPSHAYGPGIYDVEMRVGTDFGVRYTIKREHITVWADTCDAQDVEIAPNTAGYVEIMGTNAIPVTEMVIPIRMTNVISKFFLDSISFVGTRLDYFELEQIVFDNKFSGELAVRVKADNGGGSPALPPGTGPVARIHFRSRTTSLPGDTSFVNIATLGAHTFKSYTTTTDYQPVFYPGTVRVVTPPCDCPWQADLDGGGTVDAVDLAFVIDIVFFGGADIQDPDCPRSRADFNNDGVVDAVDLAELIDHVFFGGAGPADPCNP